MSVKSQKSKAKPKLASRARAKEKVKPKSKVQPRSAAKGGALQEARTTGVKTKKALKSKSGVTDKTLQAKPRTTLTAPALKEPAAMKMPVNPPLTVSPMPAAVPVVKRTVAPAGIRPKSVKRTPRAAQYSYMKTPGVEHVFEVGDNVEVFCDHEKNRERIRGWLKGIVVQVDHKLVAVQFRSNVFLTDGWMVPDRILWYPLNSEHIRPAPGKKSAAKKEVLPDY